MEMPIQVIIVLFILVLVGGMLLMFSQNLITKAEESLPTIGEGEEGQTKVVELETITDSQVAYLAGNCFVASDGKSLKSWTCFIIHAGNGYTIPADSADILDKISDPTVRTYVDVQNLGETTKTVFVNWNSINYKVEVKP